jgi:hypothetical protein
MAARRATDVDGGCGATGSRRIFSMKEEVD